MFPGRQLTGVWFRIYEYIGLPATLFGIRNAPLMRRVTPISADGRAPRLSNFPTATIVSDFPTRPSRPAIARF